MGRAELQAPGAGGPAGEKHQARSWRSADPCLVGGRDETMGMEAGRREGPGEENPPLPAALRRASARAAGQGPHGGESRAHLHAPGGADECHDGKGSVMTSDPEQAFRDLVALSEELGLYDDPEDRMDPEDGDDPRTC